MMKEIEEADISQESYSNKMTFHSLYPIAGMSD
jgi:hypothetical protein